MEGVWEQRWWWPALEKEGGRRGAKWRLWNWIWSCCKGIGSDSGWAVGGRIEGRRIV